MGRLHKSRPSVAKRAAHATTAPVQDMGVDHRGAHILVAEKLLDDANVVACFEQLRGGGMAERVAPGTLGNAHLAHGSSNRALRRCLVDVVLAPSPALRFLRRPFWGKTHCQLHTAGASGISVPGRRVEPRAPSRRPASWSLLTAPK